MGEERGTNIMSERASLEPEKVLNNDKISIALWELQDFLLFKQPSRSLTRGILQHKAQEEQAHE